MKKTFRILIACLAIPAMRLAAQDLVFETSAAKLTLSDTGRTMGLTDKSTGQDLLQQTETSGGQPFAFARAKGRAFGASAITREGDILKFRFANSGVEADYRITARASYILIELLAVRGAPLDEMVFTRLPVAPAAHSSALLNAQWDDRFTVCLMALDDRFEAGFGPGGSLECTAHPEFGIPGHAAVLIAVPTPRFLSVVQEVEKEFKIPHANLDGQWAKTSDEVRRGYLFVDLTESNADEMIRRAKLGGFGSILIYSSTWSTSAGSYPLALANYPRGEASLRAIADKCHAAGLKLGIHTMTSFVSKNDPLVRPRPDSRLLKDGETRLAAALDEKTKEIAVASVDGFCKKLSHGADPGGMDVQIDDEIIRYDATESGQSSRLLGCTRGANGTRAAPHNAGAKVHHLAQRYNHYLADLKTTLKDEIAARIAGVINRCELDMVYFDGGQGSAANGPKWYWLGALQSAFFSRLNRDVLVQGAGKTHWTWHFYSRGTCDDFAALAPKQYLDYHKIADLWQSYHNAFMPAELGWWGLLSATPDHPATMPDEVEFYAVRMLALDSPVSLETKAAALTQNGRTEEMLKLLGDYEQLRLSNGVSSSLREKLKTGEWHGVRNDGRWQFHPVRYDSQRADLPAALIIRNTFETQPLRFRMQVMPALAAAGDHANITLLAPHRPQELPMPSATAAMPGALAHRTVFAKPAGDQDDVLIVGANDPSVGKLAGKRRDLVRHRALAVCIEVQDSGSAAGSAPAVLNVQLESAGQRYRDHYIDLDFTGERTIILPSPTGERMLPEFRPARSNYTFKHAGYTFDYSQVVALNLRWMRLPPDKPVRCRIKRVEALAESDAVLQNPRLTLDDKTLFISATLHTGDYAEFWGEGSLSIYSDSGVRKQNVRLPLPSPIVTGGEHRLRIDGDTTARVKWTQITLGKSSGSVTRPH